MSVIPWLAGLPTPIAIALFIALLMSVAQLALAGILAFKGKGAMRRQPALGGESEHLWVFFVPALNEEVTIADTVQRLVGLRVTNKIMMIIDDGSTDATPQILAGIDDPDLSVLRRDPPNAQQGKGAALNNAWVVLHERLRTDPRWSAFPADRVLVTVVDADGRLDPDFANAVAGHFHDPAIGGVQLRVEIYNTWSVLARLQDVEFRVYGALYQMGRAAWGTAGMGGNGQINRLSALDDVARYNGEVGEAVPWRDRLTEDQDLGISLLACNWHAGQELRAAVHQQGLANPRRLLRQRTRWAQGCLQACRRMRVPLAARIPLSAKAEYVQWLLQPIIQFYVGLMLFLSIALVVVYGITALPFDEPWEVAVVLFLSLGGTTLGCTVAWIRTQSDGLWRGLAWSIPYALYSWFMMPVYIRAMFRELSGRSAWAKTAREPISRPAN